MTIKALLATPNIIQCPFWMRKKAPQTRMQIPFKLKMIKDVLTDEKSTVRTVAATAIATVAHVDLDAKIKGIELAMNAFAHNSMILCKALDAVSQIHPFVGGTSSHVMNPSTRTLTVVRSS